MKTQSELIKAYVAHYPHLATLAEHGPRKALGDAMSHLSYPPGITGPDALNISLIGLQEPLPEKTNPVDPDEMNGPRADYAHQALTHFQLVTHMRGESLETLITDLLTDIAHLCSREGLQLRYLVESAREHYADETGNFGPQFDGI